METKKKNILNQMIIVCFAGYHSLSNDEIHNKLEKLIKEYNSI
jgi:hypothetical protein